MLLSDIEFVKCVCEYMLDSSDTLFCASCVMLALLQHNNDSDDAQVWPNIFQNESRILSVIYMLLLL